MKKNVLSLLSLVLALAMLLVSCGPSQQAPQESAQPSGEPSQGIE